VTTTNPPDQRLAVGAPPSAAAARLTADRLEFRYRRRSALAIADVDLIIDGPGIWGLVGPNGAGKSTLLKMWAGIERPTGGAVRVAGFDPWAQRRRAIECFAYVPQTPAIYGSLSVADHLLLAKVERPSFDAERSRRYLDSLRIPVGAKGSQLSGGQRAQLGLAIALGTGAPILLLDEPLASLDPLARRDFLAIVREAATAAGTTVVLSSHVVSDLEEACDRLLVLGDGVVLLDDSIAQVVSVHWVLPIGAPDPQIGRLIASFAGRDRVAVRLWQAASVIDGAERATVEDVVVGYLTMGRDRRHVV
jgi:ABC-2 type transport system ATP-binding protein